MDDSIRKDIDFRHWGDKSCFSNALNTLKRVISVKLLHSRLRTKRGIYAK